jgi:hypothetical protein
MDRYYALFEQLAHVVFQYQLLMHMSDGFQGAIIVHDQPSFVFILIKQDCKETCLPSENYFTGLS